MTDDPAPSLDEVRRAMSIPSIGTHRRGQKDGVGFATTAEQMAAIFKLSAESPPPQPSPEPGRSSVSSAGSRWSIPPIGDVVGVICPHDDYAYAGRVYRRVLPLIRAKTVVLIGVFHRYRQLGLRDRLVFDPYTTWQSPDGDIPVSSLRDDWTRMLPDDAYVDDPRYHDGEHSVEALAYWLRHSRPDLELIPLLVPGMTFPRMQHLAEIGGEALARLLKERGLSLGPNVAIVISADAIHYGQDFEHTPFGTGGIDVHARAVARDLRLLETILSGPLTSESARRLFETLVNPEEPDRYRITWCGRFSIPFGLLLLEQLTRGAVGGASAGASPVGHPIAYGTSVSWLPLTVKGLGTTAPANFDHFVGYPGVAITAE